MQNFGLVNTRLGKYFIQEEIGRGGMGAVYRAYDLELERHVALKVLAPHLLGQKEFVERFMREGRAAARLKHLHIVDIYDVGQEGGWYYFVMAYLPGPKLTDFIRRRGACSPDEVLCVLYPLAQALQYAHSQGVIHRDVKPDNVILDGDGGVTLTDFGIARATQETRLTVTGSIMGTPAYMSPEQARGFDADAHSDQYSLAVVAYEMLSGRVPFQAENKLALLHKVAYDPLLPVRQLRPELSAKVDEVLGRALAKDPQTRYPSVIDFVEALAWALNCEAPQDESSPAGGAPPGIRVDPSSVERALILFAGVLLVGGFIWLLAYCVSPPLPAPTPWVTGSPTGEAPAPTGTPTVKVLTPTAETLKLTYTAVPVPPTPSQVPPEWGLIPAGTFVYGSDEDEITFVVQEVCSMYSDRWCRESAFQDELPAREIYLDSFYIDRYEVTNAQYALCVNRGPCDAPASGGNNPRRGYFHAYAVLSETKYAHYPVVYVTWENAKKYCEWKGARLPTAEEWEKAARGDAGRRWPWGDQIPSAGMANFRAPGEVAADWNDTMLRGGDILAVGTYPKDVSPYGVMDMAGNVMEWVADCDDLNKCEIRGGSWNTGCFTMRGAGRTFARSDGYFDVGFRCARDVEP